MNGESMTGSIFVVVVFVCVCVCFVLVCLVFFGGKASIAPRIEIFKQ